MGKKSDLDHYFFLQCEHCQISNISAIGREKEAPAKRCTRWASYQRVLEFDFQSDASEDKSARLILRIYVTGCSISPTTCGVH